MNQQAREGDTVAVHYTGRLDDGSVFDSSADRDPLTFTLGEGQVIEGFEQAVEGMAPGETRTVSIAPSEGYGPYHEDLLIVVDRSQIPPGLSPEVGQQLALQQHDGADIDVRVSEVTERSVTLDANHPLAGLNLTFEIELVAIR